MLTFAIDAITGFSIRPLRLAAYLGIVFGVFAVFLLGCVLAGVVSGWAVAGWASVMSVVAILGSVQLVILGEYLGRLYLEAKNRPLFVISEIVRDGELDKTGHRRPGSARLGPLTRVQDGASPI